MQLSMMPATVNVPPTIAHTWDKLQFNFQGFTIVYELSGFFLAFSIMKKAMLSTFEGGDALTVVRKW